MIFTQMDSSNTCLEGATIIFNKICLPNSKEVVLIGKRINNVYLLDISSPTSIGYLLSKHDESWLWHRRIAHIHMHYLNKVDI